MNFYPQMTQNLEYKKKKKQQTTNTIIQEIKMNKKPSLMEKINLEFSHSESDTIAVNILKVKQYLSDTKQKHPQVSIQNQPIKQIRNLFKIMFDSNKGLLLIQTNYPYKNYLENQSFSSDFQTVFSQFMKTRKNKEQKQKIDFMDFLQFWLQKNQKLTVFYEKQYDLISGLVKDQLSHIYNKVSQVIFEESHPIDKQEKQENSKSRSSYLKVKPTKSDQSQQKIQKNKDQQLQRQSSYYSTYSNKASKSIQNLQQKDPFNYYLRKFYDHYCKKYLNSIKGQQFQKLQEFYNSMNLNKFLMYCKDLKLLRFQSKLTAKSLQQMFKAQQNHKHSIEYEGFAKIIKKCLQQIFQTQQIIETKGFELIGVLNRQNFVQVMGKIGVLVPLKKTVMVKPQLNGKKLTLTKSRSKDTFHLMKQSILKNYSTINGHGYESHWDSSEPHPDLFLNEKQRKQQRLLQCLSIPKLNKLQPSKFMDQKLQQLVDSQYDPYLRRYNEKSIHQNSNGVLKRMDERINNVVKKIR